MKTKTIKEKIIKDEKIREDIDSNAKRITIIITEDLYEMFAKHSKEMKYKNISNFMRYLMKKELFESNSKYLTEEDKIVKKILSVL